MSDTKFTKGEWSVVIDNGNAKVYCPHGFLTSANVIKIDDSRLDGESWIEMRDRTSIARERAKVESNANMHLISAAPEMYEMIQSDIASLEFQLEQLGHGFEHLSVELSGELTKKKQLLAKARGES